MYCAAYCGGTETDMDGLNKITEHIIEKAHSEADRIIEKANSDAAEINRCSEIQKEKIRSEAQKKLKTDCDRIIKMGESADRQNEKRLILEMKSAAIGDIILEAKNSIKNCGKDEYVRILKTLLKNSVPDKNGEVLFSKKDKELADGELAEYITEISGGRLKLSGETIDIDSGFVIRCGKIEINCSVDSIFEDKLSRLTDIVNACVSAAE